MEVVLYSIDDLIGLIKSNRLTKEQIKIILHKGYYVLMFGDETIEEIITFLECHKDSETMPLFVTYLNIND